MIPVCFLRNWFPFPRSLPFPIRFSDCVHLSPRTTNRLIVNLLGLLRRSKDPFVAKLREILSIDGFNQSCSINHKIGHSQWLVIGKLAYLLLRENDLRQILECHQSWKLTLHGVVQNHMVCNMLCVSFGVVQSLT
jgi:hypothetical protein